MSYQDDFYDDDDGDGYFGDHDTYWEDMEPKTHLDSPNNPYRHWTGNEDFEEAEEDYWNYGPSIEQMELDATHYPNKYERMCINVGIEEHVGIHHPR